MFGEVRQTYTPQTLAGIIRAKEKRRDELIQVRINLMHRKKSDHPRYQSMNDHEFHEYKIKNHRDFSKMIKDIEDELKNYERIKEKLHY